MESQDGGLSKIKYLPRRGRTKVRPRFVEPNNILFPNTETNIFPNPLTMEKLRDIITQHTETYGFLKALCEDKTNQKRV